MMKICVGAYVRLCMDGGGITDIRCLFKLLFSTADSLSSGRIVFWETTRRMDEGDK